VDVLRGIGVPRSGAVAHAAVFTEGPWSPVRWAVATFIVLGSWGSAGGGACST